MNNPEEYSDLHYWRLPPPTLSDDLLPARQTGGAAAWPSVHQGEEDMDTQEYNDFSFWHTRPQMPSDVGLESAGAEDRPSSPGGSNAGRSSDDDEQTMMGAGRSQAMEEDEEYDYVDEGEDAMEEATHNDAMAMLSGGAGARLLGLLGQLSQHLGASSRFARAAELLQEDMLRQREHAQRMEREQEQEAQGEQYDEETIAPSPSAAPPPIAAPPDAPLSPERRSQGASRRVSLEPLEGSTLAQPEVRASVGSLLSILQQNDLGRPPRDANSLSLSVGSGGLPAGPGIALHGLAQAAPLVLFDVTGELPPPSPASPESVAHLSPPCPSSFRLEGSESPLSCPICLEALDEPSEALQMPCARQHVFHKACLLTWLDSRNTCPICRHGLPEATEAERAEAAIRRGETAEAAEAAEGAPSDRGYLGSLDA
jgi:hypothetical protein